MGNDGVHAFVLGPRGLSKRARLLASNTVPVEEDVCSGGHELEGECELLTIDLVSVGAPLQTQERKEER